MRKIVVGSDDSASGVPRTRARRRGPRTERRADALAPAVPTVSPDVTVGDKGAGEEPPEDEAIRRMIEAAYT